MSEEDKKGASEVSDTPGKTTKKQNKTLSTANAALIVVALVVLGLFGYLYNDKSSQVDSLRSEVSTLKKDAVDLKNIADSKEAAKSIETVKPKVTTPPPKETPQTPVVAPPVTAPVPCSGSSTYTASIGKFKATLSSPYVIIRKLDAGFEGGPITNLNIATCLVGETNVYDFPPLSEVSILGHPASTSADLKSSFEATSGTLTADGTVTVDGVTAHKYKLSGMLESTLVYFDKAGIGYQIELSDTNATSSAILTDLISDWTFTP